MTDQVVSDNLTYDPVNNCSTGGWLKDEMEGCCIFPEEFCIWEWSSLFLNSIYDYLTPSSYPVLACSVKSASRSQYHDGLNKIWRLIRISLVDCRTFNLIWSVIEQVPHLKFSSILLCALAPPKTMPSRPSVLNWRIDQKRGLFINFGLDLISHTVFAAWSNVFVFFANQPFLSDLMNINWFILIFMHRIIMRLRGCNCNHNII